VKELAESGDEDRNPITNHRPEYYRRSDLNSKRYTSGGRGGRCLIARIAAQDQLTSSLSVQRFKSPTILSDAKSGTHDMPDKYNITTLIPTHSANEVSARLIFAGTFSSALLRENLAEK
jgi:hypothetical protein